VIYQPNSPEACIASILIRPVIAADCPALAALVSGLGYASTAQEMEQRLQAMPPAIYRTFVAEVDGRVVGLVGLMLSPVYICNEPMGWILVLVVDPAHRYQGIGSRLLRHAEQFMARRGVRAFQLHSKFANEQAHSFYRAQGYGPEAYRFLKQPDP
jgi:GNAT superfamily N-acetyltransferase